MRICSRTRSMPVIASVTGMLHLQAGVHLDEEELAVLVEELDGADAEIAELATASTTTLPILARCSASMAGEGASSSTFWWRRCSEQSRSPRCTHVAEAVGDHLHLDVPRLAEVALHIDRVVAERGLGLGAGRRERPRQAPSALSATFMPRPPPPAAALISTGKPISSAAAPRLLVVPTAPSEPGTTGMPAPSPPAWR